MVSVGWTLVPGSVTSLPLTVTLPWRTSSAASRREQRPPLLMYLLRGRISEGVGFEGAGFAGCTASAGLAGLAGVRWGGSGGGEGSGRGGFSGDRRGFGGGGAWFVRGAGGRAAACGRGFGV